jgi:hypothetical protein
MVALSAAPSAICGYPNNPQHWGTAHVSPEMMCPWPSPVVLAAWRGLRGRPSRSGRYPAHPGVSLLVQGFFEWGDYKTADRPARRLFTGTSTDMATAATLSLLFLRHTAQECVARMTAWHRGDCQE